jgi:hypothetical protein
MPMPAPTRAERLRLIIADEGKDGNMAAFVTEADVHQAREALKAIEVGQNPPQTEVEISDQILNITRPVW